MDYYESPLVEPSDDQYNVDACVDMRGFADVVNQAIEDQLYDPPPPRFGED
jgi:predicted TIM-barrel enzyme